MISGTFAGKISMMLLPLSMTGSNKLSVAMLGHPTRSGEMRVVSVPRALGLEHWVKPKNNRHNFSPVRTIRLLVACWQAVLELRRSLWFCMLPQRQKRLVLTKASYASAASSRSLDLSSALKRSFAPATSESSSAASISGAVARSLRLPS
jgi:hypothetical protein